MDENWDISDYEVEVCEYWLVSHHLAKKLEEKGETVCHDLYGLTIWSRTTSGQVIWMDYVIQAPSRATLYYICLLCLCLYCSITICWF